MGVDVGHQKIGGGAKTTAKAEKGRARYRKHAEGSGVTEHFASNNVIAL
jgi:hypothetical protein